MFTDYSDVVGVDELCHMLSISKKTAYDLLHKNLIHSKKVGKNFKIRKEAIILYLEN